MSVSCDGYGEGSENPERRGIDAAWTEKCVLPGGYTIVEVKRGNGSEAGWGWMVFVGFCEKA